MVPSTVTVTVLKPETLNVLLRYHIQLQLLLLQQCGFLCIYKWKCRSCYGLTMAVFHN